MNKEQKAILWGLVIGDGHISNRTRFKDGKYRYEQAELIIAHSPKQRDYAEHKAKLCHSLFGGNKPTLKEVTYNNKTVGKVYSGVRWAKTNPYLRLVHKELYLDKRKRLTKAILDECNEVTLALWYMDDGTIMHNKNKEGEVTSLGFRICTQFETQDEADLVLNWLSNKFGIDAKKFSSKGKWDIGGATTTTLLLVSVIQQHIIPSMAYKILPAAQFVIRKSAKHPRFTVDEDIVRTIGKPIETKDKQPS